MPFFISNPSLIRVVPSFMCLREGGLQEASILPATSHSSWKKVLSFLDLRYFSAPCVFSTFLFDSSYFLAFALVWSEDIVLQEILLTTWVIFVSLGFSHTLSFVKDPSHWEVVEPLPSYGRGIDLPGGRYRSLINGYMLHDVVITGTCNFQVLFAIEMLFSKLLYDYHIIEMMRQWKSIINFFVFTVLVSPKVDFHCHVISILW